jgi:hypothetical protein
MGLDLQLYRRKMDDFVAEIEARWLIECRSVVIYKISFFRVSTRSKTSPGNRHHWWVDVS